jgi:hypothetical protein
MSDSATRRELERSLRALLPETTSVDFPEPNIATAGVSGFAAGYLWGWWRGRHARRARARHRR